MPNQSITAESGKLRVPFARLGAWFHPKYGLVKFSQGDFDTIITNFENDEAGFEPYLTFGHLKNPEANDDLPSKGTLKEILQDDDVLVGIFEPKNAEVVKAIEDEDYRYSSAELYRKMVSKTTGEPIGPLLTAVALTNAPFVPGLPAAEVLSQGAPDEFFRMNLSLGEGEAVSLIDALEELSMDGMQGMNGMEGVEHAEHDEKSLMASLLTSMNTLVDLARGFFTAKKIEEAAETAIEMVQDGKYEQIDEAYSEASAAARPAQEAASAAQKVADEVWSKAYQEADEKVRQIRAEADAQIAELEAVKLEAMMSLSMAEAAPAEGLISNNIAAEVSAPTAGEGSAGEGTHSTDDTQEGVPSMSPAEGEAGEIMNEELEKIQAEMKAMSERLSATEAVNEQLKVEKEDLVQKLSVTAETASKLSQDLAEKELKAQQSALVGEGIPPVMAEMALSIAQAAGEQKLSINGSEVSVAEQVFALLRALPQEHRVDLSQAGGVGATGSESTEDVYDDIFKSRFGK